jgi:hypothetical protein
MGGSVASGASSEAGTVEELFDLLPLYLGSLASQVSIEIEEMKGTGRGKDAELLINDLVQALHVISNDPKCVSQFLEI